MSEQPVGGFDPQPCVPDDIPVPLDVNIVSPDPLNVEMAGPDPLNVNVTNQLTEPLDVNLLTPDPVNVNVISPNPVPVDLVAPDPVNVLVTNQLTEPLDVNLLTPDPVNVNIVSPVPLAVSASGPTAASTTLSAVTTGNGTTVDFASARSNVVLFIQVNGTVTAGVVDLQASHDGVNWVRVASSGALATGTNQYLGLSGGAFRYFRGVVSTTVTGGGTVTATLMYA